MAYNYLTGGLQGGSTTLQGSAPTLQAAPTSGLTVQPAPTNSTQLLQPTVAPSYNQSLTPYDSPTTASNLVNTAVDPAVAAQQAADAAAAQKAAEDAAKAAALREQITGLVNSVKEIFNSRYGLVDKAAGDATGSLNERFGKESAALTSQIDTENQAVGAAHAAGGTYDSSYRGNNVDTVTKAGTAQIGELGDELKANTAKIGEKVSQQKQGFDQEKSAMDLLLSRLAESTDPAELTNVRNTLDAKIASLQGGAEYNTQNENIASLKNIAPATARGVALKTTLSQIIAGTADNGTKSAIANKLVTSAGLDPAEAQKLLEGFNADLAAPEQQKPQA